MDVLHRGMHPLSDDDFNWLALSAFRFQFEHNLPYRSYCERRGAHPDAIAHWLEIPSVPTAAFKEVALVAGDPTQAEAVFRTSGTTQGKQKRGAHHVLSLELYDASLLPAFQHFVLGDAAEMPMATLVTQWQPGSDSSLGYMVTSIMGRLGSENSIYAIDASGIREAALHQWVEERIEHNEPVCLMGTSLAFVHWFERLQRDHLSYRLPEGSRLMDTGGFKGAQISIGADELRNQYHTLLGIPPQQVINEYGMTEMLSQFYDAHLGDAAQMLIKQGPPWVRSAVVDPDTLQPLPNGETGLLRHFDLANLFSVSAIQTEDLAVMSDAGFRLLGRAGGAAPRGCSIAMDIFLSGARR